MMIPILMFLILKKIAESGLSLTAENDFGAAARKAVELAKAARANKSDSQLSHEKSVSVGDA